MLRWKSHINKNKKQNKKQWRILLSFISLMVTFAVKNDVRQCQPSVCTFIVGFTTQAMLAHIWHALPLTAASNTQQQRPFYGHYTGQTALAGTSTYNRRILLVKSFTAHIQITEKTLEFSSTVSYSVSIPLNTNGLVHCCYYWLLSSTLRCGDSVDNTIEENSSIFSLIRMCWLPSARACWQYNFAPTESSSS